MGKKDTERELIFAQARIESLEEQLKIVQADKVGLAEQITKLQDSLISVMAPDAYRDQQLEREDDGKPPVSAEALERNRITAEVTTRYLRDMEGPMFRDGHDLDDLLKTGIIRDTKPPASLHDNEES